MAKPNRKSFDTLTHLTGLIRAGHLDMERFLDEYDNLAIRSNYRHPLSITEYVSRELDTASATSNFLRYSALRQLEAFLKKNTDLPGSDDQSRVDAALASFASSERKCKRTNKRLRHYFTHPERIDPLMYQVMRLAQSISHDIFGSVSRLTFHKICERSGFGPGFNYSSTDLEHRHRYYKVGGPHAVTAAALPYVKVLLNYSPHWRDSLISEGGTFDVVGGNRVTTVPKTAITNRTIAIEPSLNVYIQKGVDSYLKERLRHHGVTLTNQVRNHPPARRGSTRPLYAATVDLSSASDLISTEIVRFLVPQDWYTLLDDLRSQEYTFDRGRVWHRYEKFSSMGNAFTFPLESIIFYSIAKACTIISGSRLSVLRVYGDDIVIDPRAALLLYDALKFAGFTPNTEKSFIFGHFRETCGSDFLAGVDLRPVYVRRCPRNDQEIYNLYNRLLRHRLGFQFHNLCEYLYKLAGVPLIGPPDLPRGKNFHRWYAGKSVEFDSYFHAPRSEGERFRRWDPHLHRSYWRLRVLRFKPKKQDTTSWNMQFWYLCFLTGVSSNKGVDSVSFFRRKTPVEKFYRWEDPPWSPSHYDCFGERLDS